MASWVAPSIAAEIWGTSVEQILAGVADGSIQSRMEGNFLFVLMGVAENRHPPTTTPAEVVSAEELTALHTEESTAGTVDYSKQRLVRFQTSLIRKPPIAA